MKQHKILFIDDDKDVIQGYLKIFEKKEDSESISLMNDLFENTNEDKKEDSSYELHTATQGEDGVRLIEESLDQDEPFSVAFIDMRMPPGIDGRETCRRIRALDKNIEIVIVTAYSDHDLNEVVDYVGHPNKLLYLKKPFDKIEIIQLARNLTEKWKAEKTKDEFLASLSHELKTPLVSIIGFSQLLHEEDVSDTCKSYNEIILQNGKLMKALLEDLFTMITIGKKNIELNKEKMNLSEVSRQAAEMYRPLIKDSIELIEDTEEEVFVSGDFTRLKQVVINLISNANKFTNTGSIKLVTGICNDCAFLKVKDTGVGISKKDVELIFEKFKRLESDHHEIPGLGLGLSISKTIIDLHEGWIEVNSNENEGSEFILNFKAA